MKKALFFAFGLLVYSIHGNSQGLYDLDSLRSIYITFDNPEWHDTLVAGWYEQSGHREVADLEMNGVLYEDVAIRYKGNATFFIANDGDNPNPKLPLNIDINDINEDQDILGFNKLKLSSSFFDPTILRDVLGNAIYRNYMPASEANWMKVYIDNEYLGLYPNIESVNKQFLKKHFDYKNGVLIKCDPAAQFGSGDPSAPPDLAWYGADSSAYYLRYTMKTDHGWSELVHLLDVLNNAPENLESVLNIDRALWYLAVSTAIANYDSYNGLYIHNYYLYQHEDGLFQFIPWDLSESFVGILLLNAIADEQGLYEWDIFLENDPVNQNRALLDYVREHPVYRKQYLAHIRTIIEEVLDLEDLSDTVFEMHDHISDAALADENHFFTIGDLFFESNLTENVNFVFLQVAGLLSAAENRKTYLVNHPEITLEAPQISAITQLPDAPQPGAVTTVSATVADASQVDLMVTNNGFASFFQAIPMYDDGMHGDGEAGDDIYGATIPFSELGDHVQYYVRAQNEEAMSLSPQRAEYEFYEYDVQFPTNIDQVLNDVPQLSVLPNPSTGVFVIEGSLMEDVEIFDGLGRRVKNISLQRTETSAVLDLSRLTPGVYFLRAEGYVVKKLILMD